MNPFLRKLGWVVKRRQKEADLREELEFHLTEESEDARAAGLTEEEARFAARRELGRVTLIVEDTRAVWGWPLLEQLAQDLRYAVRTLIRSPAFTLAAVLTLTLGIGMTTSIFSVVHGVLLRSLPFTEPDQLVSVHTMIQGEAPSHRYLSPPNFASLQEEERRSLAAISAFIDSQHTLAGAGGAQRLESARVSAGFFELFGARPILGRTFVREENEPGSERVAVLSHALWRRHFGGDTAVIGRTIALDGISHTVIGVMPPGFDFPNQSALWVPQQYDQIWSAATTEARKRNLLVSVVARLRPGSSLEAARAELAALGRRLEERFPETNAGVRFTARPLHDQLVGQVRTPLLLLLGAVGLVLLIACANVAGLLLARAASRRQEIAVRAALGARRGRIIRQLVTESLVLGLGGGLLGLGVAFWATNQLLVAHPEGIPRLDTIRVDGPVLAFGFGVTILAAVLAGLLPALRAAGDTLAATLRAGGRSGLASQGGHRFRSALVVGQLALAVVVMAGAGLLLRSFVQLSSVDPGFRTETILSFGIDLPEAAYGSKARIRSFYDRLFEHIEGHPGVLSAGAISRLPIGVGTFRSRFRVEGRGQDESSIGVLAVTPEYFRTMGIPVLRGRGITKEDRAGGAMTVVINESAAKWLFPDEDAIGRRLVGFSYDPIEAAANAFTIVGVVANVRSSSLRKDPEPEAHFAHAQVPIERMSVVVHAAGDPLIPTASIRRELTEIDPDLPVPQFRTMEQVVSTSLSRPRLFTTLLTLFSVVALALSAVGMFGLVSFAVAQRTREIGVRIALGASPSMVVRTMVREALGLTAMGLGIGLGGALALSRVLESELFDVSPSDPAAFAGVSFVLCATALLSSLVPAWRAATMDPLVALRFE